MSTSMHDNLDDRDREMIGRLDRDAARLRAEPDSGFEGRVLRAAMRADSSEVDGAAVVARIGFWRSSVFRVAAAMALMLTVGAASIVALRMGSGSAPQAGAMAATNDVLEDIDGWLALDESVFGRTSLATFREELDSASTGISYDNLGSAVLDPEEWM